MYNPSDFLCYCLSTKLHWARTTSTISRLDTFSLLFVLYVNIIVLLKISLMMTGRTNISCAPSFFGKNPFISPIWTSWLVKRPYVNKKGVLLLFTLWRIIKINNLLSRGYATLSQGKRHLYTSHIQLRRLNPFCFYKLGSNAPPSGLRPFWP